MENLFGFLIFAAIAGISAYSKYVENKKAEEQRANRPRTRPEDLPEETRRMLYGESGMPPRQGQAPGHDIPVARRKQAAPPPMPSRQTRQSPVARQLEPVQQEEERSLWEPHVPSEGPGAPELPVHGPSAGDKEQQRIEQMRRRIQQQMAKRQRDDELQRQQQARQAAQQKAQRVQAHARHAAVAAQVQAEAEGPARSAETVRKQDAERPVRARGSRPIRAGELRRALNQPQTVKRLIVMSDILGPPVGLR